jgi:hypothetical protein
MNKIYIWGEFSRRCVALFALILAAGCASPARQGKELKTVIDQNERNLLQTAADPRRFLSDRLRAVQDLAATGDRALVPELRRLLNRSRPVSERPPVNWDPDAAERVVDLHIIVALHSLGSDADVHRVAALVEQAGDILVGPDEELKNQVFAIVSLGRLDVLAEVVGISAGNDLNAKRNAVRVLDSLKLPESPLGGSLASVPHMGHKVSFSIKTLSEELHIVEERSQGSIVLSAGVREYAAQHDYDRGTVRRQDVLLSDIVLNDLRLLDFDYFIESGHVVVCTYSEASSRWRDWWGRFGKDLEYRKDQQVFVLQGRH